MTSLFSVIPIVLRRMVANARLLAAVTIGAVLASALMSTTSIYTDSIRDLGLSFALRERGVNETNLLIRISSQPSAEPTYRSSREFIESSVERSLGALVEGETSLGRSATFFPTAPGGSVSEDEDRPRSHFQFLTGLEPNIVVSEGRLPAAATSDGSAPSVEVALGGETARATGLSVGDRFDLHPFWLEDATPVRVTIVGIVEPIDLDETYWLGIDDLFFFPAGRWDTYPFFVPEETFFGAISAYLPTMTSDFWQLVYLDTGRIDARSAERVRFSLEGLDRRLRDNLSLTTLDTELTKTLATFDEKLFFTRIPLLVLVLQIAAIVLYYLFMVSTMLVERQTGEIALLKSRGATTAQIMQIYVAEGLAVAAIGLALGPPLAAGVISLLGQTPPFTDLSGGANLSVRLTATAYLWAASGAVLAFATLLWPAYQATKSTMVQQRVASARPPKQPAFTRYYIDLVLVAIGGLLLYQLERRGSLVTERFFGEQTVDPVQLLTPAFFILTVGIFFLRLFPMVLRLLAWIVARVQGTAVLIGMWQLVRNPVHYSRLVLLLMLATAVGMFAASFGATLNESYEDRAEYEAGAPLRLKSIRALEASGPDDVPAALTGQLEAEIASPVTRLGGSTGPRLSRLSFEVLAVDPASFGEVTFFRDDFADESLASLLDTLAADEPDAARGIALPSDARWLGVWLNPVELNGRTGLEAKVRDASGRYFTVDLGPALGRNMEPGWQFLIGDLTQPGRRRAPNVRFLDVPPEAPLRLESLGVRFISRASLQGGTIQLDDLQTSATPGIVDPAATARLLFDPDRSERPFPAGRIVDDFEAAERWEPLRGLLPEDLADESHAVALPDGVAIELTWRPIRSSTLAHGLRLRSDEGPLAVLGSEAFMAESGLGVGDVASAFFAGAFVEIEVVDDFSLFPTLEDPRSTPTVVMNGNRLLAAINGNPLRGATYPNEVWLVSGPESVSLARKAVDEGRLSAAVVSFADIREAQEKDPLVAAGWEGILFISFAAILLLSAIGFLIYSYLTAQKRTLEFAVLRTMGFSRRQIATVVGFEQAFVIFLGMAAGTLLGIRLGSLMIRYMGLTETGEDVVPPMLLQVSWLTVGSAWLILGFAFLVTIGIVVLLYSRLALHTVLRMGET